MNPLMENLSRLKGAENNGGPKLSDKYKQAADELVEVARTQGYAKAISMLTGDNTQQPSQQVDPAESLAKMASVAKDMFGIEDAKSRSIREDAQQNANVIATLVSKIVDMNQAGASQESPMMKIVLEELREARAESRRIAEKAEERLRELQREHKEDLEKAKTSQSKKDDDPVENFKNQLLINRLNYQPPSVRDQLEDAKEVFAAFGINPLQPQTGASDREMALKEKEIDAKLQLAQLEWNNKKEIESQKISRMESLFNQGTTAIMGILAMVNPKVAEVLAGGAGAAAVPGNTGANAAQDQQQAQPQSGGYVRVACPNPDCDLEETAVPREHVAPAAMPPCPHCGTKLVLAGDM